MIPTTGDTVKHLPSGEEWLVACAHPENDALYPIGWPPTRAKLSDCVLVEKATPAEREKWLGDLSKNHGSDHRWLCARAKLGHEVGA